MEKLPNKYIWDDDSSDTFTNILKSEEYELKVQALLDKKDLKMEDVKELLMATANTAKIRKTKARNKKKDQPWFDKECLVTKKEILLCGKILRSSPEDVNNREKLYTLKRKLRNMIKKNKNEYKKSTINNMCSDLNNGEQKQYWKNLRKLEGRVEEHKYIPDSALVDHFKLLLFDDKINLEFEEQDETVVGSLDYPIDLEELNMGTKILKNGKGTGIDIICNEMLVPLVNLYPRLVLRAFNEILQEHGVLCKDWLHSLVSAIHKKGVKEDPDNYRGISLMSCLGKLFLTIIKNRLTEF